MTATFYVGDAIEVMSKLPEKSVDLVLTSPPFLALRSYLPLDHPDKALEGGSQATPGEFIDWLVDVVEACDRVLAPHGSLCIELGDTYSGSGGAGGDYNESGLREGEPKFSGSNVRKAWIVDHDSGRRNPSPGWPLAKSLSLIPELFRLTLVYGTNPLTGRTTERWRLRNVVRWVRPNPPVGALGDKFRPATSELMVFCKSAKRYFDLDAVREPTSANTHARLARGAEPYVNTGKNSPGDYRPDGFGSHKLVKESNPAAGAPPLDWWKIPAGEPIGTGKPGRSCPNREGLSVRNMLDHLRIRHRRRLDSDVSMEELTRVWNTVHPEASKQEPETETDLPGAPPLDWWKVDASELEEAERRVAEVLDAWGPDLNDGAVEKFTAEILDALKTKSTSNLVGAPPLDWWNIPPGGFSGAHYAVWPPELLIKPIKAMSPERVCKQCGEPSRRIVEHNGDENDYAYRYRELADGMIMAGPSGGPRKVLPTGQWTTCGHDDWRPGVVLDCFAGSGTTLLVATGHGRDAIGIDLDARNFDLALDRVGPLVLSGPYRLDDSPIEPPQPESPASVRTPVDAPSGGPL